MIVIQKVLENVLFLLIVINPVSKILILYSLKEESQIVKKL